jgi:hypothetical protein
MKIDDNRQQSSRRWDSGESILMRHVHHGRVLRATPVRVVRDDDQYLAVWVAPGSEQFYPFGRAEDGSLLPLAEWRFEECIWWGWGMLELTPPGRRHTVRLVWDEHGVFEGWYVNLQEPIRRRKQGYDTMDWQLDIWVTPDGTPSWKDEDDLESALRDGLLTKAQSEQARAEGQRVIEERPWPTGFERWRPPAEWRSLPLPDGWAAP